MTPRQKKTNSKIAVCSPESSVIETPPSSSPKLFTPEPEHPPPKLEKVRKTSAAAQTDRRNAIRIENHKKRAWKQATSWYAEEKEKKDGFLAEHIAKEVKKNTAASVHLPVRFITM